MIKSFACKETEKIFNRSFSDKFPSDIQRIALRKLRMLNRASVSNDFKNPPNNKPEILRGNRKGKYAFSLDENWKLCFEYKNGDLLNLEIINSQEIINEY